MISPPQVLWDPLLMIFIYLLCVCASAPASTWRSEDGFWGWFLQSILWFPGLSSGCRFWRQSPLSTQPSQQSTLYSSYGNLGSSGSKAFAVTVSQELQQERTETYFKEISRCNFPGKNKYLLTLTPWRLKPKAKDVFRDFGTYLRYFDL